MVLSRRPLYEIENVSTGLPNWFRNGIVGKKIIWIGDSSIANFQTDLVAQNYFNKTYFIQEGSPLYGTSNVFLGVENNSITNFMSNWPTGFGIDAVTSSNPDLVVIGFGIDAVRIQATSPTYLELAEQIKSIVVSIRSVLPRCDILLCVPNSLLSTNVGNLNYVVPNSWAQTASDILRLAYAELDYKWPNVATWNSRNKIFSDVIQSTASHMQDQIHPSTEGLIHCIDDIVTIIGQRVEFSECRAQDAQDQGYFDDYTRYPLVVENGIDYTKITGGLWINQGSGFLEFEGDMKLIGNFRQGDILVQNGKMAWPLPESFTQTLSINGNILLGSLGNGTPPYAQVGGTVFVYRRNYAGIIQATEYLDSDHQFHVRCKVLNAGNGFINLAPVNGELPGGCFSIRTTDILVHPVLGSVPLTGASIGRYQNTGLSVTKVGTDFTMLPGAYEVIVFGYLRTPGTDPIEFSIIDSLNYVVLRKFLNKGGIYKRAYGLLGTAGGQPTVVHIQAEGTTVLTLTFAASATTPTYSWSLGAQFCANSKSLVTAIIDGPSSSRDIAILIPYFNPNFQNNLIVYLTP